MHKFVRNLITQWRNLALPVADKKILIAVSGGADSVSLTLALHKLYELKKLKTEFYIAHFNHKLRGEESEKDALYVQHLAESLNFPLICGKPETKIQCEKGNLEQLARNARYDFLWQTATELNASIVVTAHTLNDQAETFLFNLLRGSGIQGLSGMKAKRSLKPETDSRIDEKSEIQHPKSNIELVRPLLNWAKREDTEKFCSENNVSFRNDAMNNDLKFARVRIRKELIPFLQTFNPKIIETLAKTSELLEKDTQSLAIESIKIPEKPAVSELKELPETQRLRYLRSWLETRRGNLRQIEFSHLRAIENLVLSVKSGRVVELPGCGKVIKNAGKLSFEIDKVEKRRLAN